MKNDAMKNDDTILDPICDMVVSVSEQRGKGLTATHEGREYAFCGAGCLRRFQAAPAPYVTKVSDWLAQR